MPEVGLTDPWDDAALRATLSSFRGVGNDAGLPLPTRFLAAVASLIRKRLAIEEASEKPPAVFFLSPRAPEGATTRRFPMLDNGLSQLCGRFWFTSHAANDGLASDIAEDLDDSEIFRLAEEEFGVGHVPAVILDVRTASPEVRFYPDGIASTSSCELVRIQFAEISIAEIFAVISRVYKQALCTPDAMTSAGNFWVDSRRGWAARSAELQVQAVLKTALIGAFPTCNVRDEQPQPTGRLDIEIEEPFPEDRSKVERHALLELKVLRARGSTGNSVAEAKVAEWIVKGVEQAAAYRIDKEARASALCCFDMRDDYRGPQAFDDGIRAQANKLRVELGNWHLFRTSEDYRRHVIESDAS